MKRRDVITLLGGAAAWPHKAWAQQPERMRRIGVLMATAEDDLQTPAFLGGFKQALRELGWIEGRNIQVDYRFGAGDVERIQKFARELVNSQPDLIVGHTTPGTAALARETKTIPIIFVVVSDPIGSGFVASLPKPGGNATGFATIEGSLGGKWVELLKEIAPHVERVFLLFNPITAPYYGYVLKSFNAAAVSHGMQAITAPVKDITAVEAVAAAQANEPNGGLVVLNEDFTIAHREEIVSLIGRYRLPAVYPFKFFAEIGGLASYGIDLRDNFQRAASYVDRILKGEKPTDLPVQAPTKFELAINLKTRQPLGSMCPPQC